MLVPIFVFCGYLIQAWRRHITFCDCYSQRFGTVSTMALPAASIVPQLAVKVAGVLGITSAPKSATDMLLAATAPGAGDTTAPSPAAAEATATAAAVPQHKLVPKLRGARLKVN